MTKRELIIEILERHSHPYFGSSEYFVRNNMFPVVADAILALELDLREELFNFARHREKPSHKAINYDKMLYDDIDDYLKSKKP
jgi:hypothetical protein